jgi:hypothetical protein
MATTVTQQAYHTSTNSNNGLHNNLMTTLEFLITQNTMKFKSTFATNIKPIKGAETTALEMSIKNHHLLTTTHRNQQKWGQFRWRTTQQTSMINPPIRATLTWWKRTRNFRSDVLFQKHNICQSSTGVTIITMMRNWINVKVKERRLSLSAGKAKEKMKIQQKRDRKIKANKTTC